MTCNQATAEARVRTNTTECNGLDKQRVQRSSHTTPSTFAACINVMPETAVRKYFTLCNQQVSMASDPEERRKAACAIFEAFVYDCENNNYDVGTIDWRDKMNCSE